MKSYDLIIKNAQIHTMDEDRKVYAKGILGIEGEKITLIKEMNELTPEELQECEGAGRVIKNKENAEKTQAATHTKNTQGNWALCQLAAFQGFVKWQKKCKNSTLPKEMRHAAGRLIA